MSATKDQRKKAAKAALRIAGMDEAAFRALPAEKREEFMRQGWDVLKKATRKAARQAARQEAAQA